MPKKKKKYKSKKKSSKKRGVKSKKKTTKNRKILKQKKRSITKISKKIENSQPSEVIFKNRSEWIRTSLVNKAQYKKKYNESIKNNNTFWKKEGKRITWIKPYTKIKDIKYS